MGSVRIKGLNLVDMNFKSVLKGYIAEISQVRNPQNA